MKAAEIVALMKSAVDPESGKKLFRTKDALTEAQIKSWLARRASKSGKQSKKLDEEHWEVEAIVNHKWTKNKLL